MKKILSIVLAVCMIAGAVSLIACNNGKTPEETTAATTDATTATPVPTGDQPTTPGTTTGPAPTTGEETSGGAESYMWFDDINKVDEVIREHTDPTQLRADYENLTLGHFAAVNLLTNVEGFDYTADPDDPKGSEGVQQLFDDDSSTKNCCGKDKVEDHYIIWEMDQAVTAKAYIMVTANDNEEYPDRNPTAWALLGCNDADYIKTRVDMGLDEDNHPVWQLDPENPEDWQAWKVIDVVYAGDLPDANFTEVGFAIDEANWAAYQYYMIYYYYIEPGGTVYQVADLVLLGTAG